MPVHNADIAAIFDEIADLLESGAAGWNAATCSTPATSTRCARGSLPAAESRLSFPKKDGGGESMPRRPMPTRRFLIPDKIRPPMRVYYVLCPAGDVLCAKHGCAHSCLHKSGSRRAAGAPHFNGAGKGQGNPDQGQLARVRHRNRSLSGTRIKSTRCNFISWSMHHDYPQD